MTLPGVPRAALRRALPWLIDGGMAVGFAVLAVVSAFTPQWDDGYPGTAPEWQSAVVGAITPAGLLLRRRRPFLGLALMVAFRGLTQPLLDPDRPFYGMLLPILVGFGSCIQYARRPWNLWAVLLPVALYADYWLLGGPFRTANELIFSAIVFSIAGAIGGALRILGARNTALERELAVERRADELRRAGVVSAVREQIAVDLDDAIAQRVSAMLVLTGSARLTAARSPAESAEALRQVEQTGRDALAEIRRALGLLRAPT